GEEARLAPVALDGRPVAATDEPPSTLGVRAPDDQSPLAAFDLVAADLLVEVRALDAEDDRGAGDVPAGELERVDDVLPLGLLSVFAQREVLAGHRHLLARRL